MRFAANLSLLFTELPYRERPAAAADAGFDAVETWWPFGATAVPTEKQLDEVVDAVAGAGVPLVALNFFAGDMPNGDRGLVSDPDRVDEFRSSLPALVAIAERTGCRLFNALYGVRRDGLDPAVQDRAAIENLTVAANAVAPIGGTILIEALADGQNGAYPLTSPSDVAGVIDRLNNAEVHNVGMLADFYHFTSNGYDWRSVIDDHAASIAHVQIADVPGRNEPGTGTIDFEALLGHLQKAGYDGYVGLEYRPSGATVDGLGYLKTFATAE